MSKFRVLHHTASSTEPGGNVLGLAEAGDSRPALMRAEEVAAELQCSKEHVYAMMRSGALPTVKLGRSARVHRAEFERWLSTSVVKPSTSV